MIEILKQVTLELYSKMSRQRCYQILKTNFKIMANNINAEWENLKEDAKVINAAIYMFPLRNSNSTEG